MTAVLERDDAAAPAPSWSQVPLPGAAPRGRWDGLLLALWIALVGPFAQARFWPPFDPWRLTLIGAVALVVMFALPRRWWGARLVVAGAAGVAILLPQGRVLAVWLVAGLLLALWVAQDRPPLPFFPSPGPGAAGPVAVLCTVAAWQGLQTASPIRYVVPFALAWLMPLLAYLGHGLLQRVGDRVGSAVGTAVSAVLFTLLGVLTVATPWLVQRLFRHDPLHTTSGWATRERPDPQAGHPWAPDPHARPRSIVPALVLCVSVLAGLVGLGALLFASQTSTSKEVVASLRSPGADPTPPGGWYDAYRDDVAWALSENVALVPFETRRLLDVRTRTVNITDGHRASVEPTSGNEPLNVWLYGGNAAFGFEQRDDHTIASELIRVAAANGIAVRVSNRGVPGQLHWRGSQRFAEDLATLKFTGDDPPDLVLFYDGFEEVSTAQELVGRNLGDVRAPYEAFGELTYDRVVNKGKSATPTPPEVTAEGWPTVPGPAPATAGELAARRYERSRRTTIDRARVAGVPVVFVWQAARTKGATAGPTGAAMADASARLPDDVLDLTRELDGNPTAFVDDVHHDETGARLVAARLFDSVRPRLELIAEARR
jgi:hypothetical protein